MLPLSSHNAIAAFGCMSPLHTTASCVAGTRALHGFSVYGDDNSDDCYGHGTHVSGIVGGLTFGVAKNVTLHAGVCPHLWLNFCVLLHLTSWNFRAAPIPSNALPSTFASLILTTTQCAEHVCSPVRCISCDGSGQASAVTAALDWLAANVQLPAIASMSLGAGQPDTVLDTATTAILALGVTVVTAAGNFNDG